MMPEAGEENYLESFSRIIEEQGRRRRAEEDAALKQAESAYLRQVEGLRTLGAEELVVLFRTMVSRSFADPRMTALTTKLADAAGEEIISRLERK